MCCRSEPFEFLAFQQFPTSCVFPGVKPQVIPFLCSVRETPAHNDIHFMLTGRIRIRSRERVVQPGLRRHAASPRNLVDGSRREHEAFLCPRRRRRLRDAREARERQLAGIQPANIIVQSLLRASVRTKKNADINILRGSATIRTVAFSPAEYSAGGN